MSIESVKRDTAFRLWKKEIDERAAIYVGGPLDQALSAKLTPPMLEERFDAGIGEVMTQPVEPNGPVYNGDGLQQESDRVNVEASRFMQELCLKCGAPAFDGRFLCETCYKILNRIKGKKEEL